jgi:hypothetical protein
VGNIPNMFKLQHVSVIWLREKVTIFIEIGLLVYGLDEAFAEICGFELSKIGLFSLPTSKKLVQILINNQS